MRIAARLSVWLLLLIVVTLCGSDAVRAAEEQDKASSYLVYVGTYTQGRSKGKGIYRFRLDMASGALKSVGAPTEAINPSFLALHPGGKFLYAVNETGAWEGRMNSGAVSAYAIDARTGDLTFLNRQLSRGGAPCHLSVDATGRSVHVANYSGGSVISFPIGSDGRLGSEVSFFQHEGSSVTPRQKGPHAHCINLDAGNKFAFVADLGLDKVLIYRLDAKSGKLTVNSPAFAKLAPGSGPRHFAIHPDQKHAYVINEMASTVTVFNYDAARGSLEATQTITTLPEGFEGRTSTAEVFVHPSGKFLYGSNRGHNSIVAYRIDPRTGKLTYVDHQGEGVDVPRNFAIDPTGTYLLVESQGADTMLTFRIDQESGRLEPTGHVVKVPAAVSAVMLPWDGE